MLIRVNMKHVLIVTLFVLILMNYNIMSGSPITVAPKLDYDDRHEVVPIMTLDLLDDGIMVSSLSNFKEVIVVVKDMGGCMIHKDFFSIGVNLPYFVSLPSLESGMYVIEIFADGIELYGNLIIE